MQWSERAIILSCKKLSEHDGIVTLFAPSHGVYRGVAKAAFARAHRAIWQPGNIVTATWRARIPEQLGMLTGETAAPIAAHAMSDRRSLTLLASLCALLELALPERDAHPELYGPVEAILHKLARGEDAFTDYGRLERDLLSICGFGLDLSRCAATGGTEELVYVSPKSGRAVSREAGLPYHRQLLPLPDYLHPEAPETGPSAGISLAHLLDGLLLTGYFLDRWLLQPRGVKMPQARLRLTQLLEREASLASA